MQKLVKMDENLEFKNILAGVNSGGIDKVMYLLPYAKNVEYSDGNLSMVLEFVNNNAESEIGIKILLSDELQGLFDRMLFGEEV
jgi:hypothetical protein